MTRRRWIADEVAGNRAILIGQHAHHLAQVLRAKIGQEFDVSTDTEVRRGRISSVAADRVEFELGEVIAHSSEPQIIVALSVFKFDRMEWAIEKCTELGVTKIIPVIAARTEPHLVAAAEKRVERWRRIAKQASEQSRRVLPPELPSPAKLVDLSRATAGQRIVLDETETKSQLTKVLDSSAESVTLAFGPEGGWKPAEIRELHNAGWRSASLGHNILRAETAVIAAVAIAVSVSQQQRLTG